MIKHYAVKYVNNEVDLKIINEALMLAKKSNVDCYQGSLMENELKKNGINVLNDNHIRIKIDYKNDDEKISSIMEQNVKSIFKNCGIELEEIKVEVDWNFVYKSIEKGRSIFID